jgi:hypothetical protein
MHACAPAELAVERTPHAWVVGCPQHIQVVSSPSGRGLCSTCPVCARRENVTLRVDQQRILRMHLLDHERILHMHLQLQLPQLQLMPLATFMPPQGALCLERSVTDDALVRLQPL